MGCTAALRIVDGCKFFSLSNYDYIVRQSGRLCQTGPLAAALLGGPQEQALQATVPSGGVSTGRVGYLSNLLRTAAPNFAF